MSSSNFQTYFGPAGTALQSEPIFYNRVHVAGPVDVSAFFDAMNRKWHRRQMWIAERRLELRGQAREIIFTRVQQHRVAQFTSRRSGDSVLTSKGNVRVAAKARADARKQKLPMSFREAHIPARLQLLPPPLPRVFWLSECNFTFSSPPPRPFPEQQARQPPHGKWFVDCRWWTLQQAIDRVQIKDAYVRAYAQLDQQRKETDRTKLIKLRREVGLQYCLWGMREYEFLPVDNFQIPNTVSARPRQRRRPVYPWGPVCQWHELRAAIARDFAAAKIKATESLYTLQGSSNPFAATTQEPEKDKMDLDDEQYRKRARAIELRTAKGKKIVEIDPTLFERPATGATDLGKLPAINSITFLKSEDLHWFSKQLKQKRSQRQLNGYERKFLVVVDEAIRKSHGRRGSDSRGSSSNSGSRQAQSETGRGRARGRGKYNGKGKGNAQ